MESKRTYIILAILGVMIGVSMQLAPHLQGYWGRNFITLMSGDLGCWAVIAMLIASYAKASVQSGSRCLMFNVGMVVGYYTMAPYSAMFVSNYIWFAIAVLMFPIGMLVYWYKSKLLVLFSMIAFLLVSISFNIISLIQQMQNNQIPVYSHNGTTIFSKPTWFTIGNEMVIILFSLFGIIYMIWQYKTNKITVQ